jgi:hypothetical protein
MGAGRSLSSGRPKGRTRGPVWQKFIDLSIGQPSRIEGDRASPPRPSPLAANTCHIGGEDRSQTAGRGHGSSSLPFEAFRESRSLPHVAADLVVLEEKTRLSMFWSV